MRERAIVLLVVLAGVAYAATPAAAQDSNGPAATPMGGMSEDQRVRERDRMRREYEQMRERRAEALREAREQSAADSAGEAIPGWRDSTGGPGRLRGTTPRPDDTIGGRPRPPGTIEGLPKYLLYAAIGLLGIVIVVRFRRGR